jgi:hypothetical protein
LPTLRTEKEKGRKGAGEKGSRGEREKSGEATVSPTTLQPGRGSEIQNSELKIQNPVL